MRRFRVRYANALCTGAPLPRKRRNAQLAPTKMGRNTMGGLLMRLVKFLAAVALALTATAAQAQSPVKIRVGWVAPVSNWASIWLEKKDLAQHLGKSYTFEAI